MAQYEIKTTKIGTGETANIADDKAIPIYEDFHFPPSWSKAFDVDFFHNNKDFSVSILHGKASSDAQLSIGFGLAGPNWAGTMDVAGKVDGNAMQLDITNDNFVSGMLIGAGIDFTFNLEIQFKRETLEFDWRHPFDTHWKVEWHELFREDSRTQLDVLTSMFNLAKKIESLAKFVPGISKILKVLPNIDLPIPRSYNQGIAGHVSSSSFFPGGLEFPTELEASWDLVQIAEAVGATAVEAAQPETTPLVELVLKLNKVLKAFIKPTVETGPVMGIKFITFLRISGVNAYWGDDKYQLTDVDQWGGTGVSGNIPSGAPDSAPTRVGFEFDHRPAVDFDLGWYAKVSWLKIFCLNKKKEFGAGDLYSGFTTPIGQAYTYEIRNNTGSTSTGDVAVAKVNAWIFDKG